MRREPVLEHHPPARFAPHQQPHDVLDRRQRRGFRADAEHLGRHARDVLGARAPKERRQARDERAFDVRRVVGVPAVVARRHVARGGDGVRARARRRLTFRIARLDAWRRRAASRAASRRASARERAPTRLSRARGAARAPTRRAASSEDVDGSGSGDRPTTTTRRRALAASLALARAVTIDLGAVRAPSARAASSTFDDDPFARNDGARVLDRVKTSGTAATTTDEGRAKPGVSTETEAAKDETVRDEAVRGAAAAPEAAPGPEAVSKPAAPKPAPPRVTESSTKVDTKALLNNTRIKTYNNAPVDFPAFFAKGTTCKVIHGNDYTVREDGLIVKDYLIGEGESPKDNQECTFNYVAYNENGGTIDSTYRRGAPASTRLGSTA